MVFKEQTQEYIIETCDRLNVDEKIKKRAHALGGSIYWYPARPSSIANSIIFLVGSFYGMDLVHEISKKTRKTKDILLKWANVIREDYGW